MAEADGSGDSHSERMKKLREDIRPYFMRIDCNLRVLGSQFGLEPSELTDLELRSVQTSTDFRLLLLNKCFEKEKITSWEQFVSVLEKPVLIQAGVAMEIRRTILGRQVSMDSAGSSITSVTSCTSPMQSLTSSMEASLTTAVETKTGSKLCGCDHMSML